MSSKERFGTYVWQAVMDLTYNRATGLHTFASVGQVADAAGVSNTTAKKYLLELSFSGDIGLVVIGKRTFYQYVYRGDD